MVVTSPAKISEAGGLRSQFSHVVDIAPILAAAHIPQPKTVDGIEQTPMAGLDLSAALMDARLPNFGTPSTLELAVIGPSITGSIFPRSALGEIKTVRFDLE
ncbi:hypothetical protein [Stutzerimonas chloritidismutans]|jgi:hypothetical protein|uniref:Uncharacterized protein n=1 Tax=Stutzerimonas chloritidismutans TaxID=203192 RepID=A0ABU9MFP9_STUCH